MNHLCVSANFGNAQVVYDKFHVIRNRPAGTPRGFILSGYSMGA